MTNMKLRKQRIETKRYDTNGGSKTTTQIAFVCGPLSLHQESETRGSKWHVTHLASGKCLLFSTIKSKAKKALFDCLRLKVDWYSSYEQLDTLWKTKPAFKKRMKKIAESTR